MHEGLSNDRSLHQLQESWSRVGGYLRQAIRESAESIDDRDLTVQIEEYLPDDTFPEAAALILLEKAHPGIADHIITRTAEIQKETEEREWEVLRGQEAARNAFGRVLINGFRNNFGL
jgi:hypothetical protein